jgi:23S rRNA (guanosine2251-2'-O)-methyltransferase
MTERFSFSKQNNKREDTKHKRTRPERLTKEAKKANSTPNSSLPNTAKVNRAPAWIKTQQREPAEDICWGRQPVLDLLRHSPKRCLKLSIANNVRPPFLDELTDLARESKVVYQLLAPEVIDGLCPRVNHQGVACRVAEMEPMELGDYLASLPKEGPLLVVVLDHIEDPHNLGAIIRSAEAAGAAGVIFGKRRSALPGGTVVKVSAGAALRVPLVGVVNISRAIKDIKEFGLWTVGLENKAGAGDSIWMKDKIPARAALIVGAEDEGISRLAAQNCDDLAYIPISGETGSLNASVACAVAMFEWSKNN